MASQANTSDSVLNGEQDGSPQINALAQYIKDLSAENPSAPQVFQWQATPQLDVQFNLNVSRISDDVHEVILRIELKAASEQGAHFLVDLSYAGVFGMINIPEDAFAPFLLVEAPRLLFPFARQIVAEAVQNLGFPPVLLDPIDFAAAYMAQLEQPGQDGESAQPPADANADADDEPLADAEPAGNA
ncbi:MAG: protein-export chaperone SecB [Pseudomonadota bacterium]|nr:protein-export chaperone SecB [Pseudomonadota bacterium]